MAAFGYCDAAWPSWRAPAAARSYRSAYRIRKSCGEAASFVSEWARRWHRRKTSMRTRRSWSGWPTGSRVFDRPRRHPPDREAGRGSRDSSDELEAVGRRRRAGAARKPGIAPGPWPGLGCGYARRSAQRPAPRHDPAGDGTGPTGAPEARVRGRPDHPALWRAGRLPLPDRVGPGACGAAESGRRWTDAGPARAGSGFRRAGDPDRPAALGRGARAGGDGGLQTFDLVLLRGRGAFADHAPESRSGDGRAAGPDDAGNFASRATRPGRAGGLRAAPDR